MTYEAIQKQIAKLQAQAAKMELAQGAAKKKSVAKVVALMKKLGISPEDIKGAEPIKPAKAGRKHSAKKTSRAREFDTSGVILGIFGPRVLKNQGLRKVARNSLYWQT
jgi:DNA-binding protein H-NS